MCMKPVWRLSVRLEYLFHGPNVLALCGESDLFLNELIIPFNICPFEVSHLGLLMNTGFYINGRREYIGAVANDVFCL